MSRRTHIASALFGLASIASAQTVFSEVAIGMGDGAGVRCGECAITASLHSDDLLAVWHRVESGQPLRIYLSASTDGGATFTSGPFLGPCGSGSFDPMVARALYDGRLWAGGITGGDGTLLIARKDPGQTTVSDTTTIGPCQSNPNDKAFMIAGPSAYQQPPGDDSQSLYIAWTQGPVTQALLRCIRSLDLSGPAWPSSPEFISPTQFGLIGKGAFPLVIPFTPPGSPNERGLFFVADMADPLNRTPARWMFSDQQGLTGT
jgi:hypothetical protein